MALDWQGLNTNELIFAGPGKFLSTQTLEPYVWSNIVEYTHLITYVSIIHTFFTFSTTALLIGPIIVRLKWILKQPEETKQTTMLWSKTAIGNINIFERMGKINFVSWVATHWHFFFLLLLLFGCALKNWGKWKFYANFEQSTAENRHFFYFTQKECGREM